jgi:serine/threonine-protein kinase
MLTGRPPFRGRDAADTLAKQINEAPVPLRELNPTIPKGLADAIMRCLQKDPWERFPNALDLRGALEAVTFFSDSGAIAARESGVQRTLVLLIAALALLVGLVVGQMLR